MRFLLSPLVFLGTLATSALTAQTMPFAILGLSEQAVKESEGNRFVTAYVSITHAVPEDKRPFKLTLKSPAGSSEIEVKPTGEVVVPKVPRKDWEQSTVSHNLERGALMFTFGFQCRMTPDVLFDRGFKEANMAVWLAGLKNKYSPELARFQGLGKVGPEALRRSTFAVTGLKVKSAGTGEGSVSLMLNGKVVETLDFARKAEVDWPFEKYDPATHSLRVDGLKTEGVLYLLTPAMAPAAELPKGAVKLLTFE